MTEIAEIVPNLDPDLAAQTAAHFGVSPIIHSKDYIMHFLFFKSVISKNETAVLNYYFGNALNCMKNLGTVIDLADRHTDKKPEKVKLLEFASGYGRLTRHLVNDSRYELTGCDIHDEAIDFLENTLSVNAFKSTLNPDDFSTPESYDVVFALSFFSHIPKKNWKPWLNALFKSVAPGGLLIFTTHGQTSRDKHFPDKEFDSEGFHFYADTDQEDIDMEFYGTTVTRPDYVLNQMDAGMQMGVFIEGLWWNHQDVYAIRKLA